MKGLLVAFEGNDASGKSTVITHVHRRLEQAGLRVRTVPEFSSRVVGRFLQKSLVQDKFLRLNDRGCPSALTETLYTLSDLYSQDEFDIKPALQQGMVILKERHRDSIVACQVPKIMSDYPTNNAHQIFGWVHQICSQLTEPDLTILLRVPDKELKKRIKAREGVHPTADDFAVFRERQMIYDRLAIENEHRWFEVINDNSLQHTVAIILKEIMRRWVVH